MTLIFGGAYQGKLDYALERFGLTLNEVHTCGDEDVTLCTNKPIIYGFENWLLALVREGHDVPTAVTEALPSLADRVVLVTDISAGVVPLDATLRAWREEVGRATVRLAQQADDVIRMFVGIPTKIK